VCGQLLWGVATAAGLSALLVASRPAFLALRFVGAAYLIWLGIQALRGGEHGVTLRRGSGFRQGFLSNAGNPKMAIFFTSLLPQFGGSLIAHSLLFSALTLLWLALVVRIGSTVRIPRVVDYVTGVALIGFGGALAVRRT
jgi:threonine/homoserine/homoserine lactone efflux protein